MMWAEQLGLVPTKVKTPRRPILFQDVHHSLERGPGPNDTAIILDPGVESEIWDRVSDLEEDWLHDQGGGQTCHSISLLPPLRAEDDLVSPQQLGLNGIRGLYPPGELREVGTKLDKTMGSAAGVVAILEINLKEHLFIGGDGWILQDGANSVNDSLGPASDPHTELNWTEECGSKMGDTGGQTLGGEPPQDIADSDGTETSIRFDEGEESGSTEYYCNLGGDPAS